MRAALILASALLLAACGALQGPDPRARADLFRGDRVVIDRDFIYLDDPLFLQGKSAYGYRSVQGFAFRLPMYFNAGMRDTLRFGPGSIGVRPGAGPAPEDGSPPPAPTWIPCLADTGEAIADTARFKERFPDSGRILILAPRHGRKTRIDLTFLCPEYHPPLGRTDTLILAFRRKGGPDGFEEAAFSLPFHVSFRGPVVSIVLGLGLLYLFTQAGVWIAEM